jgi:hypothetical protein
LCGEFEEFSAMVQGQYSSDGRADQIRTLAKPKDALIAETAACSSIADRKILRKDAA